MAFVYNSLEWSLKCNSDGDVIAGHCGDPLRALHTFVPHGEGGGGRENALRAQGGCSPLLYRENACREF